MKRIRQGGEGRGGVAGVRRRGPYLRGLTQPRNRLGTRPHAGLAHPPEIAEAELGHALKARGKGGGGGVRGAPTARGETRGERMSRWPALRGADVAARLQALGQSEAFTRHGCGTRHHLEAGGDGRGEGGEDGRGEGLVLTHQHRSAPPEGVRGEAAGARGLGDAARVWGGDTRGGCSLVSSLNPHLA